jgi:C-terminal processing protease CtpA/Prc
VRLPEGNGLWLTYARYLTPTGDAIQGKGLTPAVEVDEPETDFGEAPPAKDGILDAALDRIHKKAAA